MLTGRSEQVVARRQRARPLERLRCGWCSEQGNWIGGCDATARERCERLARRVVGAAAQWAPLSALALCSPVGSARGRAIGSGRCRSPTPKCRRQERWPNPSQLACKPNRTPGGRKQLYYNYNNFARSLPVIIRARRRRRRRRPTGCEAGAGFSHSAGGANWPDRRGGASTERVPCERNLCTAADACCQDRTRFALPSTGSRLINEPATRNRRRHHARQLASTRSRPRFSPRARRGPIRSGAAGARRPRQAPAGERDRRTFGIV